MYGILSVVDLPINGNLVAFPQSQARVSAAEPAIPRIDHPLSATGQ
jgi:hypothetical protein